MEIHFKHENAFELIYNYLDWSKKNIDLQEKVSFR